MECHKSATLICTFRFFNLTYVGTCLLKVGSGGGLNPGPASLGDKITLVIDDTRFVLNTSLFTAHPDTMLGMQIPVLRIWIRDPGSGVFLNPGSGIRDG
jgi:hypothetical protein